MFSILIPTYNYPVTDLVAMLERQICYLDLKITTYIYEDGSRSYTEQNSKLASPDAIIYKQLPENLGRTAIRSLMANDAESEYLLFLDADVLPKNPDFLETYIKALERKPDVIFGGISYQPDKPEKKRMLRWKYGIEREMKSVSKREKSPFFIISQNLLIKKNLFIEANSLNENLYGLDNFFSFRLKELNAHVLHIDNPVIHFGLETSESYIKKSLDAVKTTVTLEKRGLMSDNMRPIQQSFLKLKKWHLTGFFSFIISMFRSGMERNFKSENPNLFWFDLYRLNYYIQLKKENND